MEKSFQYKGSSVNYNIYGKGTVVVLLHGFGEDSRIFNKQVDVLKNSCCLIVPDLPGSGKSDMLKTETTIVMDDYADCLYALLQQENISSCILLGHSMGGYITLSFAEKFPMMLSAFGLIHSTASADTEEKKQSRQQGIKLINEYGAFSFLKNTIPNLYSANFKKNHPEIIDEVINQSRYFSKDALIQYYSAMMNRTDKSKVLEESSVPVLFVIGKEDVAAPLDIVIHQVHLPKITHIHILDDIAHTSMLEAPVELVKIIEEFIHHKH